MQSHLQPKKCPIQIFQQLQNTAHITIEHLYQNYENHKYQIRLFVWKEYIKQTTNKERDHVLLSIHDPYIQYNTIQL